jgi:monoamine oxidase
MSHPFEVIVVGAGSAGLAAASELKTAGISCCVLEASPRTGGRVFSVASPHSPLAIELGAEFIHGMPPATFALVRQQRMLIMEAGGKRFQFTRGKISEFPDFWEWMEKLSSGIAKQGIKQDRSWYEILEQSRYKNHPLRPFALSFLEGFHGADPKLISYNSLKNAEKFGEKIQSDRSFRMPNGYDQLLQPFLQTEPDIRLQHLVRKITWTRGEVSLDVSTPKGVKTFEAKRVILAVPLPILKTGIEFFPALTMKEKPLSHILMGQVTRVNFEFDEPFWQGKKQEQSDLADLGFLLSPSREFGTWWSTHPIRSCRLVAWAGYESTLNFKDATESEVIGRALNSLSAMTKTPPAQVQKHVLEARCHLWHKDPLIQGAYSFLKVGAANAMKDLVRPVDKTLYFAGEHCHYQGNHASVDGAIETGYQAAKTIRADYE